MAGGAEGNGGGGGGAGAGGEGKVTSRTLGELDLEDWGAVAEELGRGHLDSTSAWPLVGDRERLGLLGEGDWGLQGRRNSPKLAGWEGAWKELEARQDVDKEGEGAWL